MEKKEHQTIGSIGALWPPVYDTRNNRIKGFNLNVMNNWEQYSTIIDDVLALRDKHGAHRITVRFIVNDAADITGGDIEARIPLEGLWKGHSLIYFGLNTCARYAPEHSECQEVVEQENRIVREAMQRKFVSPEDSFNHIKCTGFELGLLNNPTQKDLQDLLTLYSRAYTHYTISLDADNVRTLVSNPNNLVGVIREGETGSIVSVGIAERVYQSIASQTPEEKQDFKFAELSDAATLPDPRYEKKGLYTAIALYLMKELAREHFDLVYGEARACQTAVNHACRKTNRVYVGRLLKHCMLDGKREVQEQGIYENLNVWAISHDRLQTHFNKS